MSETKTESDEKRDIVVTIDTAAQALPAQALPAIALAAALARARRQALHGLFLEDEDLLKVARLPFSRELHRVGGQARAMNDLKLARAMERLADEFRSLLEQQASQLSISWSYSRAPGSRLRITRSGSPGADIMVIASPVETPVPPREHILLLDWGHPGVLKALASVLDTYTTPVEVMLVGNEDSQPVRKLLETYPGCRLRQLGEQLPEAVFRSRELRPGLVLVARDTSEAALESCLRLARCPILVAA
jgi:hypothetical protein